MELVKFNAKRTFANSRNIYQKGKGPYKAEKEKVELWEKSGHCQIIENEPIEGDSEQEQPNIPDKQETAREMGEATAKAWEQPVDYDNMEYNDLKAMAKEVGIKGYNTMKKDKLISALKGE